LPGSRAGAYADGVRLARVVRALGRSRADARALLSVAPALEAARFAAALRGDGWDVRAGDDPMPFVASSGATTIVAWTGPLGTLLRASRLVIGQAGTANEAAAACGVPIVVLDDAAAGAGTWYRMRQRRLLGDALEVVDADPQRAAETVAALLDDQAALLRMSESGRERMGGPGGARAIARRALELATERAAA